MDTKALAKSKRAHSLQHSKKKPSNARQNQKQGVATVSSGSDAGGKPIGNKHDKERARQSKLPSNWDRYDEDADLDLEGVSYLSSTSKATDLVVPKSKGADYRYLISEAKSQSQSQHCLSDLQHFDSFPSLDDVLDGDFNQGVASMLSARGEAIQSWVNDDNFIVDVERVSTREASFLSLNLHALAEQLEKIDLSERLFIEPELLPPDLRSARSQEFVQTETRESNTTTEISEETVSKAHAQIPTVLDQKQSDSAAHPYPYPVSTDESSDVLSQKRSNVQEGVKSRKKRVDPQKQFPGISVTNYGKTLSRVEATAAEAELDMLIDSFSESTPLSSTTSPVSGKVALPYHATNSSKSKTVAANLDDILDDLLDQPLEVKAAPKETTTSSHTVTKSKLLDDFDSWLDTI